MEPYTPYRPPFWRLALGGVIAGTALYLFPFVLPALAAIALLLFAMRVVIGPRRKHAFAMRWNAMTEEERQRARAHFGHRCGHPWHERTGTPAQDTTKP